MSWCAVYLDDNVLVNVGRRYATGFCDWTLLQMLKDYCAVRRQIRTVTRSSLHTFLRYAIFICVLRFCRTTKKPTYLNKNEHLVVVDVAQIFVNFSVSFNVDRVMLVGQKLPLVCVASALPDCYYRPSCLLVSRKWLHLERKKTKGRLHHPYLNRHLANGHLP